MKFLFNPLAKNLQNRPVLFQLFVASLPLILITTVILALNTITPQEKEAPQKNINLGLEKVSILLAQPIPGFYPQKSLDDRQLLFNYNLYDGLINLRSGKLEPGIAASWKNIDPNTWEFEIKKGIKFSNGRDLKLSDIKFSFDEAVKKRWPIEDKLYQISTVKIDGNLLEIKTQNPLPDLPVYLKSVPIISPDQTETSFGTTYFLGTGPYKLTSFETQQANGQISEQKFEIELNEYNRKKSNTQKISYHFLNPSKLAQLSPTDLINNYQIIETGSINTTSQNELLRGTFSKTSLPTSNLGILFINVGKNSADFTNQNNPFSEVSIRKALYQGLDTSQIISDGQIKGKSASQPVGLFTFGYNAAFNRINMNRAESRKALKDSGLPANLNLNLYTQSDLLPAAKVIAQQLKEIGINLKIVPLNATEGSKLLMTKNFTLYLGMWHNDYFSATSTLTDGFKSNGNQNFTNYSDSELDQKIVELEKTFDSQKRERLLQDSINLAMASYSWLPLWEDTGVLLVNDKIDFSPSTSAIIGDDISGK